MVAVVFAWDNTVTVSVTVDDDYAVDGKRGTHVNASGSRAT